MCSLKVKLVFNFFTNKPDLSLALSAILAFISFSEKMSPLGNADAAACADYCISLFSDLTRYVTMQNLFHDGGFSNTGVTTAVIEQFSAE